MPEQRTIERARRDKRAGKAPTTQVGEFVREEIHHVREGKHGARSARQAIAIGLSKARRAGVELPPPRGTRARTIASADAAGSGGRRRPSARRSRAVRRALRRESRVAVTRRALARQARSTARRRSASARRAIARKAVRTRVRRAAARKVVRTRVRRAVARKAVGTRVRRTAARKAVRTRMRRAAARKVVRTRGRQMRRTVRKVARNRRRAAATL